MFDNITDLIKKPLSMLVFGLVSLIMFQIGSIMLVQLGITQTSVKLGFAFILITLVVAVIASWVIIVNKEFSLDTKDYIAIGVCVVILLGVIIYLPRMIPDIFDDATIANLRLGFSAMSGTALPQSAVGTGWTDNLKPILDPINAIVKAITPFFSLLILLGLSLWIHFKWKTGNKGMKTFVIILIAAAFIGLSLMGAWQQSFPPTVVT